MIIYTLIIVILITLVLHSLCKISKSRNKHKFPPGPRGWPLIGNLPEFRRQPLTCLMKWKTTYGNIVGLRIGEYKVVILSGVSHLKEALNDPAFNSRPNMLPLVLFAGGENHGSVTTASFDVWDEVRKFTIRQLNEIEFGKRGTEHHMMFGVHRFVEFLDSQPSSVCFYDELMIPICRYVWFMTTGSLMDLTQTIQLRNEICAFSSHFLLPIGSSLWMLPMLAKIFPTASGFIGLLKQRIRLLKLIQTVIDTNRDTWINERKSVSEVENIESCNIIQGFIWKLWENQQNAGSAFHGLSGDNHMKGTIVNVLFTSVVTLSNILNWAVAYMALYPGIQQKLYTEIVEVMGSNCDRDVKLSDMENMGYTVAFMKEVFRFTTTAPFSNFHQTLEDVEFHEYWIPKGTVIIGNLYGANHDKETWGDPEVFRPERFLTASPHSYLSFSVGLRTCPGQTFARSTFFLYLVSICQNFIVDFDNSKNATPTLEVLQNDCLESIFRMSKRYHFNFQKRV